MNQRLVIGIIIIVILLISGGILFLSSREGDRPLLTSVDECKATYQVSPSLDKSNEQLQQEPFEVEIRIPEESAIKIGEPFQIQYEFTSKNPYSKATSEVYTFGNATIAGARVHARRIGWYGYYDLKEGERRSDEVGLFRIDSLGEGQITFMVQTRPEVLERNNQNIPYIGGRADLYILVTEEGIFSSSNSAVAPRIEYLNAKCESNKINQTEYEEVLSHILQGYDAVQQISSTNIEKITDWEVAENYLEFSKPKGWILSIDSPLFEVVDPKVSSILLFQDISFNKFGPTYCGGIPRGSERCEPIMVDENTGFIDWGVTPGMADVLFGITEERGLRVSFVTPSPQMSEEAKSFFKDFLSRIHFTKTSAGTSDHYVRIIAPNGITNLCLGEQTIIKWDHKGVDTVQLWIRKVGGSSYEIGKFPADFNEENKPGKGTYPWRVGQISGFMFNLDQFGKPVSGTEGLNDLNVFIFGKSAGTVALDEGYGYELGIMDAEDPSVYDVSDNTFPILKCIG